MSPTDPHASASADQDANGTAALLRQLQEDFCRKLPERLQVITLAYQAARGGDGEALTALQRHLHSLAGAGGTMGLPAITQLARNVEKTVRAGMLPEPDRFLHALRAIAEAGGPGGVVSPTPLLPLPHLEVERRILLCGSDLIALRELEQQLLRFRLPVEICDNEQLMFEALVAERPPLALVVHLGDTQITQSQLLRDLANVPRPRTHVLVLSARADFESRLMAVRLGADDFLSLPVQLSALVDALERRVQPLDDAPFRVLLVDDDRSVSAYHAAILRGAGMLVEVALSADQLDEMVRSFVPELLLLDFYMPRWNGPEIARALRQQHELLSLPIVFLSAEGDRALQLGAMSQGGDDFLTKPIRPEHLVEAVRIRAQRYRELRRVMLTDALTGVLNRRALLTELERDIARCRRDNGVLSLAMIDVDHFKQVNDKHGHQAGDAVLKALTQLLRQRLRRTDIIGRFGGEEFVIVLLDTALPRAAEVINDIRVAFGGLQHLGAGGTFSVSFSAGMVTRRGDESAADLIEQADQRLYLAKHAGRNRIVSSDEPAADAPPASGA